MIWRVNRVSARVPSVCVCGYDEECFGWDDNWWQHSATELAMHQPSASACQPLRVGVGDIMGGFLGSGILGAAVASFMQGGLANERLGSVSMRLSADLGRGRDQPRQLSVFVQAGNYLHSLPATGARLLPVPFA